MSFRRIALSTFVLSLLALICVGGGAARAQHGADWQPPVILSEDILDDAGEPADCFRPVAVADAWGQVHAFWGARTSAGPGVMGNTIYYARWDEQGWSGPYDVIFVGESVSRHAVPRVAVDADGWLHLVWLRGTTLWYSRASVWEAADPRAWTQPGLISNGPLATGDHPAAIVTDSAGTLHVLYSLGTEGGTFLHTSSQVGSVWSAPHLIAKGEAGDQVNLAIDAQDRLHAVYKTKYPDGSSVYYARSDDGGTTWSDPLLVDESDERYRGGYGPNLSNVIAHRQRVHIVWHGAPRSQRWHQWSADAGVTWSEPTQISPDLVFSTNAPSMAFDGSGVLHLVSVGAGLAVGDAGTAVLHSSWQGNTWTSLELVSTESDERADLAIGNGSSAVVVWDNAVSHGVATDRQFSVWASAKELETSPLPVLPPPSPPATRVAARTSAATSTGAPSRTPPSYTSQDSLENREIQQSPVTAIAIGALIAGLLAAGVILLRRPWR